MWIHKNILNVVVAVNLKTLKKGSPIVTYWVKELSSAANIDSAFQKMMKKMKNQVLSPCSLDVASVLHVGTVPYIPLSYTEPTNGHRSQGNQSNNATAYVVSTLAIVIVIGASIAVYFRRRKRKTRLDFMNLFSSKDIGKTVTTELAVLPAVGSKTYPMAYSPEDEV